MVDRTLLLAARAPALRALAGTPALCALAGCASEERDPTI